MGRLRFSSLLSICRGGPSSASGGSGSDGLDGSVANVTATDQTIPTGIRTASTGGVAADTRAVGTEVGGAAPPTAIKAERRPRVVHLVADSRSSSYTIPSVRDLAALTCSRSHAATGIAAVATATTTGAAVAPTSVDVHEWLPQTPPPSARTQMGSQDPSPYRSSCRRRQPGFRAPGSPDWLGCIQTVHATQLRMSHGSASPPSIRLSPLDHGMMLTCVNPKAFWLPYDLDGRRLAVALSYTLAEFPLLAGRLRAPNGGGRRLRRLAARRQCAFAVQLCNSGAIFREAVSGAAPLESFLPPSALARKGFSHLGVQLPPYFEPMAVDAVLRGEEALLKVRLTHLLPYRPMGQCDGDDSRPTDGSGPPSPLEAKIAEVLSGTSRRSFPVAGADGGPVSAGPAAAALRSSRHNILDGGCILAVTIHHAVVDGHSAFRFMDRLAAHYRDLTAALARVPPPPLSPPDSPPPPPFCSPLPRSTAGLATATATATPFDDVNALGKHLKVDCVVKSALASAATSPPSMSPLPSMSYSSSSEAAAAAGERNAVERQEVHLERGSQSGLCCHVGVEGGPWQSGIQVRFPVGLDAKIPMDGRGSPPADAGSSASAIPLPAQSISSPAGGGGKRAGAGGAGGAGGDGGHVERQVRGGSGGTGGGRGDGDRDGDRSSDTYGLSNADVDGLLEARSERSPDHHHHHQQQQQQQQKQLLLLHQTKGHETHHVQDSEVYVNRKASVGGIGGCTSASQSSFQASTKMPLKIAASCSFTSISAPPLQPSQPSRPPQKFTACSAPEYRLPLQQQVTFDRSLLFPTAVAAAMPVSEPQSFRRHFGDDDYGGQEVEGAGLGSLVLSSLQIQQMGAAGWQRSLRCVGRLVRNLISEERRWRGASGRSLVCEVLHLPADQVAQLKALAAGSAPKPQPVTDQESTGCAGSTTAAPATAPTMISTNDAITALIWVLMCDLRGRAPPGARPADTAGRDGSSGYMGLAFDLRRNGRLHGLDQEQLRGSDIGAPPKPFSSCFFGNGVWCLHIPSPSAPPLGGRASNTVAVTSTAATTTRSHDAAEIVESICTICGAGRMRTTRVSELSAGAATTPLSYNGNCGGGGGAGGYCPLCCLRFGAAAVRRCLTDLREHPEGVEQVLRTAAAQLSAPLSSQITMMANVCCQQDAMLTSWQMPYWDLDFGFGEKAGSCRRFRNQPVQVQSLLAPSPPWSAAVMAAAPPGRASVGAAATTDSDALPVHKPTAGAGLLDSTGSDWRRACKSAALGVPTQADHVHLNGAGCATSTCAQTADGLNLFILVPEGAAAALRCSPVIRELVPGAVFQ